MTNPLQEIGRWIPQTASATIPADGRTYVVDIAKLIDSVEIQMLEEQA